MLLLYAEVTSRKFVDNLILSYFSETLIHEMYKQNVLDIPVLITKQNSKGIDLINLHEALSYTIPQTKIENSLIGSCRLLSYYTLDNTGFVVNFDGRVLIHKVVDKILDLDDLLELKTWKIKRRTVFKRHIEL